MINSSENLVEENFALRQELHALRLEQKVIWSMLVDVVRKLQASSASIKAAVSSLLSYDIFWDVANQHEFLLTIDSSANQTTDLVMLLSLAFRLEADRLDVKQEPHAIQEILTTVEMNLRRRYVDKPIILQMSQDEQVVWIDYDYLSLALVLLCEVLLNNPSQSQLAISASEHAQGWKLEIVGIDPLTGQTLSEFYRSLKESSSDRKEDKISSESLLKLIVVKKLFDLQNLSLQLPAAPDYQDPMLILIPSRNIQA